MEKIWQHGCTGKYINMYDNNDYNHINMYNNHDSIVNNCYDNDRDDDNYNSHL